jgi:predicted Ser/Thr protein kinase
MGILSNLTESYIFIGRKSRDGLMVTLASAPTLADAILYVLERTKGIQDRLPDPAPIVEGEIQVLGATKDHFLYSATTKGPESCLVAVKVAVDPEHDLANEIRFLKKISETPHKNIAILHWSSSDYTQLAITPLGRQITDNEPASVSRSLISGLLEGLNWLHTRGIVHRDIRLPNIIVNKKDEAVIIDFQTAVEASRVSPTYLGGRICWPRRLLISPDKDTAYTPIPQDDLHAAILVVLNMLFPQQFDAFDVGNVTRQSQVDEPTRETKALLKLWDNIIESPLLSKFVDAAEKLNYAELYDMASLFCSPELSW